MIDETGIRLPGQQLLGHNGTLASLVCCIRRAQSRERENCMRRRQFFELFGGAALAPLTALPLHADPPDGCGLAVARDDGLPVASVNDDKLTDRNALCRRADRLLGTANVHAVPVGRSGKLVFARCFKGSDDTPGYMDGRRVENVTIDADALHDMKSVAKSVASLVPTRPASRSARPSCTRRPSSSERRRAAHDHHDLQAA